MIELQNQLKTAWQEACRTAKPQTIHHINRGVLTTLLVSTSDVVRNMIKDIDPRNSLSEMGFCRNWYEIAKHESFDDIKDLVNVLPVSDFYQLDRHGFYIHGSAVCILVTFESVTLQ